MGRIINDFYPTPAGVTQILLNTIRIQSPIFEPCAGHNAITDVLKKAGKTIYASDLLWPVSNSFSTNDATRERFWQEHKNAHGINWTVTNPPFSEAEKITPLAYKYSAEGIAMLLRLSYLEPTQGRADWLKDHAENLRYVIPINPRVKFRADTQKTDSVTCAWFIWIKHFSWWGDCELSPPFSFVTNWNKPK